VVLVGQRDLDPFEKHLIERHRIPMIEPGGDISRKLLLAIKGRPVYVHFDCDVLNPGILPTDLVVDGGLSLNDVGDCCQVIAAHDLVGVEIAEFQYVWEPSGERASPDRLLDALSPLL
jgi:arginase